MRRIGSLLLSAALAFYMAPTAALAAQAGTSGDTTQNAATVEGTPGEDYVDGDVLVAVHGGQEALEAATQSEGLFGFMSLGGNKAGTESFTVEQNLCSVPESDLAQATGEESSNASTSTSTSKTLMSTTSDDLEILLLHGDDTASLVSSLSQLDCVEYAQPNYLYSLADSDADAGADTTNTSADTTTNDAATSQNAAATTTTATPTTATTTTSTTTSPTAEPFFPNQWSLQDSETLAANGYPEATSLDAMGAWAQGAGSEDDGEVVVAVIDCGVDYTHEDLKDNMWTGGDAQWSKDLGGGTYGYNTLANGDSDDPMGISNGHGTHVASTIAAAWNGKGIAGVNNQAKIMAIRTIATSSSENTTASAVLSYNYVITAKENGVNVVAANNSWAMSYPGATADTLLDSLIYKAGEDGIISMFSAGNSSYDNDLSSATSYQASNPYLLVVGALNSKSQVADFSQWGKRAVNVFAPGTQVLAGTSNYGANNNTSIGTEGQYLPWLKGSAGASSTYFTDDAEESSAAGGITYDLVSVYFTANKVYTEVDGVRDTSHAGYLSGKSLKFNLKQIDAETGEQLFTADDRIAVRMNIPAATWQSYKDQAEAMGVDDLYFSCMGGISGLKANTLVVPVANINTFYNYMANGTTYIESDDGTWHSTSAKTSFSELENGTDAQGNMHLYFYLVNLGYSEGASEFQDDDYIYLDNISLGYAAGTKNAEGAVDNSYYYNDGTSMAAPNTTGVVSLLSSHAKAKGENLQSAKTAREIVSFIKGGVTQLDSLEDACETKGAVNASTSYGAYKAYLDGDATATDSLHPVPQVIVDNGDGTFTLKGSFFGSKAGSVTFDGEELAVTEGGWTDTAITFASNPCGKEHSGEVVVTKGGGEDALTGQSIVTMPKGSKATGSFSSLPTPDFDIVLKNFGSSGADFTYNANQVIPAKMVVASGYIYLLGTAVDSSTPALLRYDVANEKWDTKNYLEGVEYPSDEDYLGTTQSMTAGSSEIYIKLNAYDAAERLITIDAASGSVKYNIPLDLKMPNASGSLVAYDGELLLVGGAAGEPVYSAIYPDTGTVYRTSKKTLSLNAFYGTASTVTWASASDKTCSEICLTGSYASDSALLKFTNGGVNQEIEIQLDENKEPALGMSKSKFFPGEDGWSAYELDANQVFCNVAAAAADGAVVMTGPVINNEKADMSDTFIYDATTAHYWHIANGVRFAPEALANAAACVYDGNYYVLGLDRSLDQTSKNSYQRFGCYALSKLGLEDTLTSKSAADVACAPSVEGAKVEVASQVYTGKELVPEVTVTVKGATAGGEGAEAAAAEDVALEEGVDYEVSCEKAVDAGTYKVTVTGIGRYIGTATGEFVVEKAPSQVTLSEMGVAYTGEAFAGKGAKVAGSTGAVTYKYYADEACTQEVAACVDAGTYYVVASVAADANHTAAVSKPALLTIYKSEQTLNSEKRSVLVTLKAAKKGTYKGKLAKNTVVAASLTKTYGVTCESTPSYELLTAGKAEGKVTVTKAGKVTVKKGLAKGVYTLKILATSPANANYSNSPERTLYLRVLVK